MDTLLHATHSARLARMPRDYDSQVCSIARSLEVVGERWTLLVLRDIFLGNRRFEDPARIGIAPNILSDRLSTLVEHGLLERPASEDVATRKDRRKPRDRRADAVGRRGAAPDGPPRVAVHTKCGHDAEPALHCSHCGEEPRAARAESPPGPGANEGQRARAVAAAARLTGNRREAARERVLSPPCSGSSRRSAWRSRPSPRRPPRTRRTATPWPAAATA